MAVLVRSGRASIPGLRRSLAAAGVPVEVAADDTPLVREPAAAPLLGALRAVVLLGGDEALPTDTARGAAGLAAGRPGRHRDPRAGPRAARPREGRPRRRHARRPSCCATRCSRRPTARSWPGSGSAAAGKVRALSALLRARPAPGSTPAAPPRRCSGSCGRAPTGRAGCARPSTPAASAPGWPTATSTRSARCSRPRPVPRSSAATPASPTSSRTLVAQEIPADTLAERGVRGSAVRLLTAHRSKGLEWPLVVVAHAQEDGWPDLRRRSTLLQADRIGPGDLLPPVSTRDLLAEERRLFYVAVTRARERLLVTRGPLARGRRRAAVPVPVRAGGRGAPRAGPAPSAADDGRAGGRAAPHRRGRVALRRAPRCGGPAARPAGDGRGRRSRGGAAGRPRRLVGDPGADVRRRAGPPRRRAGAAHRERVDLPRPVPGPVVPRARGRGRLRGDRRRRASATSSTRSPTGSAAATCPPTRPRSTR